MKAEKNKNSITVSAPGKLLLFGEHAVVWGKPCIVTAVDKRVRIKIERTNDKFIWIEAPEVKINGYKKSLPELHNGKSAKEVEFIEEAVRLFFKKYNVKSGLRIETQSEFSSQFGFGSSSAVTACTLLALARLFAKKITKRDLFKLGYEVVLKIQKVGSGFDLASAIFGGTLFFITGGRKIEQINVTEIPLIVGYTGIKADTATLIKKVAFLKTKYPYFVEQIFNQIEKITIQGKKALLKKDWEEVGRLMNFNHGLLGALGVSSLELSQLVYAARIGGAHGAKLSGAGGGDCMIALSSLGTKEKIEREIEKTGGTVIPVKTGAEGVRIE